MTHTSGQVQQLRSPRHRLLHIVDRHAPGVVVVIHAVHICTGVLARYGRHQQQGFRMQPLGMRALNPKIDILDENHPKLSTAIALYKPHYVTPALYALHRGDARPVRAGSFLTRFPSSSSLQHQGFRQSSQLQTLFVVSDLELEMFSFAMSFRK